MLKVRTLQSTLFFSFSLVFISILIITNGFFITYTRKILLSKSINELKEISLAISSDLDEEIKKLDTVSINIAYSEMVNQSFQDFRELRDLENHTIHKQLIAEVIAIVGPQSLIKQIYLYSNHNIRISVGMVSTVEDWPWDSNPWLESVLMADGQKVLSGPVEDLTLSEISPYQSKRQNVLLRRIFFNRYSDPVGIMELVKDSKDVFTSAENFQLRADSQVIVFNSLNEIIYPLTGEIDTPFTLPDKPKGNGLFTFSYNYMNRGRSNLAAYTYSPYTGWTTLVSQNKRQVLEETNSFTLFMALVILPVLFIVLFVSFLVSRQVTRPLGTIHKSIMDMDLINTNNQIEKGLMPLNELEELNQALITMRNKLVLSLSETLSAHQHEAEARMQALQAQVNPHFMHNTINTISAMAEEGMNDDIVIMCRNVSQMMRYISDQNQMVSLMSEIEYTNNYLETMKLRFREKLEFSLEIHGDPKQIYTPRLIIQPLAENAVKHGTIRRHPWIIKIIVNISETDWQVILKDNGPGFDREILETLNQWTPDLNSDLDPGVGLTNILRRLFLWYGLDGYKFHIKNCDIGTEVLIGGKINSKRIGDGGVLIKDE